MTKKEIVNSKPNKWIAGLLGFFITPLGFLYISKPLIAAAVMFFSFFMGFVSFAYLPIRSGLILWVFALLFHIVMAIYLFNQVNNSNNRAWYSRWYGLLLVFLIVVIPVAYVRIFTFGFYNIPSSSMAPTLLEGDSIIVSKKGCGNYKVFGKKIADIVPNDGCSLKRADVIVFEYPKDMEVDYIKRVIGLPGDTVAYQDGKLYINNKIVEHKLLFNGFSEILIEEKLGNKTYHIQHRNRASIKDGFWKVPKNQYFVLGDDRNNSADSRMWGYVPQENIIGKLYYTFNKTKK